ncbi:heavy metal translocating P-type ATPase [Aporhodopirellula aestuarii]|uniref:P-type Zn(2+) transporter n=1 Tax=Aporhodopirellula aestuarii TaxID=2950107 RepID=A0ABT0U9Z9_9BACT|nr:heavy metal translocating P-type ATPase [Aporhodopirellula aestuarii]MCM2373509.1 heavy metal translocating P-type ATPase [Aporhodopirellula aestuarii]
MPPRAPLQRKIHGLDCVEEVSLLKRELVPLVGDESRLAFDLLRAKLTIDLDGTSLASEEIDSAIDRTGLRHEPWVEDSAEDETQSSWIQYRRGALTTISGVCGLAGWWLHYAHSRSLAGTDNLLDSPNEGVTPVIATVYLIGIFAGLILVLPKAWRSLTSFRPDMNLLMSVAVVGAIAIGEWFEAATVAFLFSLSLLLESWSIGRARRAISSLMEWTPPVARLVCSSGGVHEVSPKEVAVDSTLQVRPGDKIPLDGVVLTGASDVDQSPITGESVPVEKEEGDPVYAGTINGDGVLTMRTTKTSDDSTLARIIRMVSEAGSKRATAEQWVEKFAAIYTPIVFTLAILIVLIPPLLFQASWEEWIYRSLVLLVIACPCALVISTPVSVISALTSAARHGVLIKGGVFIELPASLDAIAFDKTGTLTYGEPAVSQIIVSSNGIAASSVDEDELLSIAAAIGSQSSHPLSLAIVNYARDRPLPPNTATEVTSISGKGSIAMVNGREIWMGSKRLMKDQNLDCRQTEELLDSPQARDKSVVLIGNSERVLGIILLTDPVRENARDVVALLRQSGIKTISMLTGDHDAAACNIAEQTGIDDVHSQLLPEDKVEVIGLMVEEYGNVAMVGDGVNDAPALAIATLGIAMGGSGSDAAIETADITLMSSDLRLLPWLRQHSINTLSIIRQNIVFALSIKFIFVLLTFVGYASLWAAIAADTGASLLVIFNALRLLRTAPVQQ